MSVPKDLLERVLELPRDERAELAHELALSLDPDSPERDPGYEEAWAEELESRIRDFEEGRTEAIPWREAIAKLRQELRQGPPS